MLLILHSGDSGGKNQIKIIKKAKNIINYDFTFYICRHVRTRHGTDRAKANRILASQLCEEAENLFRPESRLMNKVMRTDDYTLAVLAMRVSPDAPVAVARKILQIHTTTEGSPMCEF